MNKRRAYAAALLVMFTLGGIPPEAVAQILPPLPIPLPIGSLIVTVTSPSSGSTVSATVPVTASVSIVGSLTVVGVEFYVDGSFIGDDTTASYSVPWDTKTVGNGSHTLTAVARDLLGIRFTSDGVTVTVFNDTTPPTVTRFEETDPAISYSPAGAWVRRGPEIAAFSGGMAVTSNVAGATATFTFSGTAVSWIGLKCSICGIASVSIDGGATTSVDTAGAVAPGSSGLTSEVVFTASGLAAGSHTMVITVTGTTTTSNTHIAVDAFDVTGAGGGAQPIVTRIEDTDPAVSYTGNWVHLTDPRGTNGTGAEANEAGAVATLSFTGTEVRWIGFRFERGGIARVHVDGTFVGEVDTYAPSVEQQAVVFTAADLPRGAHTLTIEVTGTSNPASTRSWVVIDAFDVTP